MTNNEANLMVLKFLNEETTKEFIEVLKKERGNDFNPVRWYDGHIMVIKDLAYYYALYLNPIEGIDFIEEMEKKLKNDG